MLKRTGMTAHLRECNEMLVQEVKWNQMKWNIVKWYETIQIDI